MKIIEIKVYLFEELPPEMQEKVIQNQYNINVDYEWWSYGQIKCSY